MLVVLVAAYAKVRSAVDQKVLRVDQNLVVERGEIKAVVLVEAVVRIHVKRVEAVRVLEQEVLEGNVRIRRPRNRQRGQKNCFFNNDKAQTS